MRSKDGRPTCLVAYLVEQSTQGSDLARSNRRSHRSAKGAVMSTMNERLALAGIKTVRTTDGVFLERNGIRITRPNVGSCDDVCLAMFNVVLRDCGHSQGQKS